jgi:hypothetical protein
MKKIGLVGNMNNIFFPLLRYLQAENYDVTLLLLETEHSHFLPHNDTFDSISLSIEHTRLSILPSAFWNLSKPIIKIVLNRFDVLIGTGPAPAFCSRIGRSLDLFVPYGSDIYYVPFIPLKWKKGLKMVLKNKFLSFHQRRGIKMATHVMMDYTNPHYEAMFSALKISSKRYFCNPPFLFHPEFSPENISKVFSGSVYFKTFKQIRDENELVIFQHGRQEWQENGDVKVNKTEHTKGNQKLIYAFAEFLKKSKLKSHLILFEYGSDWQKSKDLIQKLGIADFVTWMPLMPRKEIFIGISLCDIGIGELDTSYFSYGSVFEFLALAKPVIHYRNDELYRDFYSEMYPMYSANTKEQVLTYFKEYESNPEAFKDTGISAHTWFIKHAINKPLDSIVKLIDSVS